MSQFIEIEFKNMLTELEYKNLIHFFKLKPENLKKQTNIYFDTQQFDLKNNHCALRVRMKDNSYELTLKQKDQVGLLETTDILDEIEFQTLLNSHIIPHKAVFRQLETMNISKLFEIAQLTTYRYEFEYLNQLIAIDQSMYDDCIDYEIELETNKYEEGKSIFEQLLFIHSIPIRVTKNKIQRATEYKRKKGY